MLKKKKKVNGTESFLAQSEEKKINFYLKVVGAV